MASDQIIFYDSKEFPLLGRIHAAWSEKGLCRLSLPAHPVESFFEKIIKTFQPNLLIQNSEPFQGCLSNWSSIWQGSVISLIFQWI